MSAPLTAAKAVVGRAALAAGAFVAGGVVLSRNFTLRSGGFAFSTDDDAHCMELVHAQYAPRVALLKAQSAALNEFPSELTKEQAVANAVFLYTTPVATDRLFGTGIAIFQGDAPIVMRRDEFDAVQDQWKLVLAREGVKDCVDTLLLRADTSAHHAQRVADALAKCYPRAAPPHPV